MLDEADTKTAASQGWQVCEVFDLKTKAVVLQILPTDFKRLSSHQALRMVMERAKQHDALSIKALTLVARSNVYQRKGRKK